MCGIVGLYSNDPVNQRLYDALVLLQHRGQNAAGIATLDEHTFHLHKATGLVQDVFRTRNMRDLSGHWGIGHVRYPTQGNADSHQESQPFYVNAPFGIAFVHNGNLTNAQQLKQAFHDNGHRHINTQSDSEVLLNVLAEELSKQPLERIEETTLFKAVTNLHQRVRGAYACIALIVGVGMLAFRDCHGIRPICYGTRRQGDRVEVMFASESVALEALEFHFERDLEPGEAIWVDLEGKIHSQQCCENPRLIPCAFEYIYFARPDSTIDGISVYDARVHLGRHLADEVRRQLILDDIDVVCPIPDSSRPVALELAQKLHLPYREGLVKNRYVGRTFSMPGQQIRKKSVRQKLNPIKSEFKNKNVLLVDDSIVRGTTMREIVQMVRDAGAKKVFVCSAAPRVRFPNVYGIDMPTREELICGDDKSSTEVAKLLNADAVVYQRFEAMIESFREVNPRIEQFECSCFDGFYIVDKQR